MSLITHTYNVTTEENVTELEEEISYDVTELRMDPDYIRYKNCTKKHSSEKSVEVFVQVLHQLDSVSGNLCHPCHLPHCTQPQDISGDQVMTTQSTNRNKYKYKQMQIFSIEQFFPGSLTFVRRIPQRRRSKQHSNILYLSF